MAAAEKWLTAVNGSREMGCFGCKRNLERATTLELLPMFFYRGLFVPWWRVCLHDNAWKAESVFVGISPFVLRRDFFLRFKEGFS
jgi:hypothetical protein